MNQPQATSSASAGGPPPPINKPPSTTPSAKNAGKNAANQPPPPSSSNNNVGNKPSNQPKPTKPNSVANNKNNQKPAVNEKGKEEPKKKCCRAGVCRCWYCCGMHCCLCPLFWLYGVALFGLSMYYGLKYTLEVDETQHEKNLLFMYWGTLAYALLFIILVQLTYLLVLFESSNLCGRVVFAVLFIIAFVLCLVVLCFTIWCKEWCPRGKEEPFPILRDHHWRARIPAQLYHLTFAAVIMLGLMILLLHIYLYNTLQFLEEKFLRENKEEYGTGKPPINSATRTLLNPVNKAAAVGAGPGMLTKYHTERQLNTYNYNNTFASIAERYRSISYERYTPTTYVRSSNNNTNWV